MKIRRNWFNIFAMVIYEIVILYALTCTIGKLGNGQEYPYLLKGRWMLFIIIATVLVFLFGALWTRLGMREKVATHKKAAGIMEAIAVIAVMTAGAAIRIWYINTMPMQPLSDYKTYFEIAQMLKAGTLLELGTGYCDYVAIFPHVLGYPRLLAVLFRFSGDSVMAALYLNVFFAMGTVLISWIIARKLAGRMGAFFTLVALNFWPSMILYNNFVAGEYYFTFLFMICVLIFTVQLQGTGYTRSHPWMVVVELIFLGLLMAIDATIRPMIMIYVVSVIICMLHAKNILPAADKNDIPLGSRATAKGWQRCLIVLLVYLTASKLFTAGTAYTVNRDISGGSSSFGYNLLVGLNTDSYGGWNKEDADYLYKSLDSTGSAQEAQLTCRDLALQRLKADPDVLLNLFVHKFEVLWGNDDYGASWNILFMDQQKNLTAQREKFLYNMMDVSDLYYATMLLMAGIAGIVIYRRKVDASYSMILMILGTVVLHLLVENQNRYHYHVLPLFAILGGISFAGIMRNSAHKVIGNKFRKQYELQQNSERERIIREQAEENSKLQKKCEESFQQQFDMEKAIKEGHITIVASEQAVKKAQKAEDETQDKK